MFDCSHLRCIFNIKDSQHFVIAAVEEYDNIITECNAVSIHDVNAHATLLRRGEVLAFLGQDVD